MDFLTHHQCSVNQYLGIVKYRFILQIRIHTGNMLDAHYQDIYTDILVFSVFFSTLNESIKKILFIQMIKKCFLLCLSFTTGHNMPCLLVVVVVVIK